MGIVAALGVAIGGITTALGLVIEAFLGLGHWLPLGILGIFLAISLPSMLVSWLKLRLRNIAPLLDANGWAINADAIISVLFGNTLTEQAQFPVLKLADPHAKIKKLTKGGKWAIAIAALLLGIAVALVVLYCVGVRVVWCTC